MKTVMVCIKRRFSHQASCAARGSEQLAARLETLIETGALPLRVHRFPCLGACELGPNVKVVGGELFHGVTEATLPAILGAAVQD